MLKSGSNRSFSDNESQHLSGSMVYSNKYGNMHTSGSMSSTNMGNIHQMGDYFSAPNGLYILQGSRLDGPNGQSWYGIESEDDVRAIIFHELGEYTEKKRMEEEMWQEQAVDFELTEKSLGGIPVAGLTVADEEIWEALETGVNHISDTAETAKWMLIRLLPIICAIVTVIVLVGALVKI